jgi:protein-S-isoprenylcysteine O-methyltransferase Ste14
MTAVYYNLIPALWVIWLVYWFVAARDVKTTKQVESPWSRAGHAVPLAVAAWLLWPSRLPGNFLCQEILPWSHALYLVGVACVAAGLGFACWARYVLGRNWSGIVTVKEDHELIRTGPYRYVRHPIYTGLLLGFIGTAIARDEWRGVLAVAIVYIALWRKYRLEERWMIDNFGDAYRRFRSEVPALIPNPFRRTTVTPT